MSLLMLGHREAAPETEMVEEELVCSDLLQARSSIP
jgi:hypothetical protein